MLTSCPTWCTLRHMKRLNDMTQEELRSEGPAWDRGDFADGTWRDAPEAIPRITEGRALVYCHVGDTGCVFGRNNPTFPRSVFVKDRTGWAAMTASEKDTVCRRVWDVSAGEFAIIDIRTSEVIAIHSVRQASQE